ncbi:FadR family transcriptional regulator [Burkholderia sp. WAC0059]|uniref:FadR/GntR family transcriptional regulator n=1 Tax=Burkholderia sp. WAC0059 TaxID=2066022 RepID=UPI000C7E9631|nr:FadR/GntR family transcriptional regulator [Burkholderia sp. WAC0059]PLZ03530.1 FadR family transcriptional regulator [Burkholderia sp. WAC0059]
MATRVTTLTDQVAEQLQDAIQTGVYGLGAKLPSGRELSRMYGVSQAVIREVTERLRSRGLIDSRQGVGCIVKSRALASGFRIQGEVGNRAELSSVFELRLDIESSAAALAAMRRDAGDLDALARILGRLEDNLYDLDAGVELDIAFHTALAGATHNAHYGRLLGYLNQQLYQAVRAARYNALIQLPLPEVVQLEHQAIYEAIRAGDPEAARAAVLEHLQEAAVHLQLDLLQRDRATGTFVHPARHVLSDTEVQ